jgi:hypothetical protein
MPVLSPRRKALPATLLWSRDLRGPKIPREASLGANCPHRAVHRGCQSSVLPTLRRSRSLTSWKDSVRAATAGTSITLSGTQTVDGVALAAGDRVLVKDQTTRSQNGIYVVGPGAWARAPDANASDLITPEMVVRVSEGTVNGGMGDVSAGSTWVLVTQSPIALETTEFVFVRADLLGLTAYGTFNGFHGNAEFDTDMFSLVNGLPDGQSDNPNAYLAASVAGYGGVCTGLRGRNGNGSTLQPNLGMGVYGDSDNGYGVYGSSASASGVFGSSVSFDGVHGETQSSQHAGVSGTNKGGGYGVFGAGAPAGMFQGDVQVNGNVHVTGDVILANADCAEEFDVDEARGPVEPGTVLVIGADGRLTLCNRPYDSRLAGVVSGAGDHRPGIILHRTTSSRARAPLTLIGKTFCKVDAGQSAIKPGDLLTTSTTPGHAMKAHDHTKAVGAVVGKALAGLEEGSGLIPILVSPR